MNQTLTLWAEGIPAGETVELVQVRKGGGIAVIAELGDWDTPDRLATQALARAQEDADAMGGRLRYYLRQGERRSKPFHRAGSAEVAEAEQVSLQTLNAALFRFVEQLSKQVITLSKDTAESNETTIRQLRKRVEQADKLHLRTVELAESFMSMQHARDLEQRRADRRDKVIERGGQQLLAYLPSVMRKILGKAGKADPKATPAFQQLRELVSQLTPEETQGILRAVAPHKAGALIEALAEFQDDDEDEQKEEEPDADSKPAADARRNGIAVVD